MVKLVLYCLFELCIAAAVLIGIDTLIGFVCYGFKKSDVLFIEPRSRVTRRAIIIFPGYTMLGSMIGKAFAPYVGDDDAIVTVDYGDQLIDPQEISDGILIKLRMLEPAEILVYGASMGGMAAELFLDQYRENEMPYGKVKLVLDTAPASRKDIKRPWILFALSYVLRGGPISSVGWALTQFGAKPTREEGANNQLLEDFYRYQKTIGMTAVATQTRFIAEFPPLKGGELTDVAEKVVYLTGLYPTEDPLVRNDQSFLEWKRAFPDLRLAVVDGREASYHLPLIEFPKATVAAMLAEYK